MRHLSTFLGLLMCCAAPRMAAAESAFTISQPNTRDAVSAYDADGAMLRFRRKSSQQELIFRRAARAARQREARIQARRWAHRSASRPNMRFDKPVVEWQYVPWVRYPLPYQPRIGSLR